MAVVLPGAAAGVWWGKETSRRHESVCSIAHLLRDEEGREGGRRRGGVATCGRRGGGRGRRGERMGVNREVAMWGGWRRGSASGKCEGEPGREYACRGAEELRLAIQLQGVRGDGSGRGGGAEGRLEHSGRVEKALDSWCNMRRGPGKESNRQAKLTPRASSYSRQGISVPLSPGAAQCTQCEAASALAPMHPRYRPCTLPRASFPCAPVPPLCAPVLSPPRYGMPPLRAPPCCPPALPRAHSYSPSARPSALIEHSVRLSLAPSRLGLRSAACRVNVVATARLTQVARHLR
jgi:hypothetical protein